MRAPTGGRRVLLEPTLMEPDLAPSSTIIHYWLCCHLASGCSAGSDLRAGYATEIRALDTSAQSCPPRPRPAFLTGSHGHTLTFPEELPPAIPTTYASTFLPSGVYHGARPCEAMTTFLARAGVVELLAVMTRGVGRGRGGWDIVVVFIV